MTKEEAAEIVLDGYKTDCSWCDGKGTRAYGKKCVVCYGNGYLVRDEWFKAQKVLGNPLTRLPGRLVSDANRIYDLETAERLRLLE